MEEMYALALDTVRQKFNLNDELFPFYVVGLYGLLCKFKDYKDIVIDSFLNTDFYFEHGSITDILERHEKKPDNIHEIANEEKNFSNYAVSNLGHEFTCDVESGRVNHTLNRPYITVSIDNTCYEKLLNSFCHELGHIIKGHINGFEIVCDEIDDCEFYFRTGFFYDCYYAEDGELFQSEENCIFDEAVNVLQTTEALSEISALTEFVQNKNILDFISKLNFKLLSIDYGYEEIIGIFKKLWSNQRFRDLSYECGITGDDKLERDFAFLGEDAFDNFTFLLDKLFSLYMSDADKDEIESFECECLSIINNYNVKYKDYIKKK